jgi:hypothetical protein
MPKLQHKTPDVHVVSSERLYLGKQRQKDESRSDLTVGLSRIIAKLAFPGPNFD